VKLNIQTIKLLQVHESDTSAKSPLFLRIFFTSLKLLFPEIYYFQYVIIS
jgi:hypothetical protein